MTLNQLVCRAASVYPDGVILDYWDMEKECPRENPNGGDTLARFIAVELHDTYDPQASNGEQVATAARAMQRASDELAVVTHALSDLAAERLAA